MKQIWRIYKTDLRNVAKHWAAIVIVLGLMILPSLYAWFNIKASGIRTEIQKRFPLQCLTKMQALI